uniref:Integrase catalytic domain-containing protein n=1 Tax=Tanacetum cinerariifolium TaxID=118510 RepID=A0A699ICM2_TANCI|nr:hypothetical protein [Tanacetum cinerariifolium]
MFFYLTTLGLARFLKETVPQVEPPPKDPLYNVYCKTTTAKELGESLERKYKIEDAGTKKFVVSRFFDYKMVDSKNVISQVEFKNYLKHKQKEMSVEDLVARLCIEEDNRLAQKDTYTPDSAKANIIKHAGSSLRSNPKGKGKDKRKNDKKSKGKSEHLAPKAEIVKQKAVDNGQKLYMSNYAIADIKGEGDNFEDDIRERAQKIKVVRSDRGGEYVSSFAELCAKHGIRHEFTAPYSPRQNGIAKRKKRTLKEMVTAMLISSAKVDVPAPKAQKIGPKSVDCIFIGYAKNNKTGSSSILDEKVVQDKRQRDDNDLQDERRDQTEEEEVEPRRSKRARNEKLFRPGFVSFMVENEPTSYREAKKTKADGTIDKYKARLVIKGFRQREGDSDKVRTPIDTIMHLSKNRGLGVAHLEYSRIIGMLMYLMTGTRPKLAYAVSRLSRHPAVIEGYSDANWISDINNSKSTSGYVFTLGRYFLEVFQVNCYS